MYPGGILQSNQGNHWGWNTSILRVRAPNTCLEEASETTRDSCGAPLHPKTSRTNTKHVSSATTFFLTHAMRSRGGGDAGQCEHQRMEEEVACGVRWRIRAPTKRGCHKQLLRADAHVKKSPSLSWDLREKPLQQAFARKAAQGSQCNRRKHATTNVNAA